MDVGLCLRIIPRGQHIEFIIEADKLEKIKKVINHNSGRIVDLQNLFNAVKLKVEKL